MYVLYDFAMETARKIKGLQGLCEERHVSQRHQRGGQGWEEDGKLMEDLWSLTDDCMDRVFALLVFGGWWVCVRMGKLLHR